MRDTGPEKHQDENRATHNLEPPGGPHLFHPNMRRRTIRRLGIGLAMLLTVSGGIYAWYTHRPQPPSLKKEIFTGVVYERICLKDPRPIVAHIVAIDLQKSKARFLTTPPEPNQPEMPYKALYASEFLKKHKLQLAINGDFFKPFWSRGPWDYYPKHGDRVYSRGLSIYQGKVVTPAVSNRPSLYISKEAEPSFDQPIGQPYYAISGEAIYLRDSKWALKMPDKSKWRGFIFPRTSIGLSKDRKTLFLIVIDGRQPGYSEGATVREMGELIAEHGVDTALDLDGGGSETLVMEGKDGEPELLNCPIDNWIPNRERPVANQLGVWVER